MILRLHEVARSHGAGRQRYRLRVPALELRAGRQLAIVGPSGCGKSTLLRCIAGLTEVDSGRILIDGEDVVPLPPQKRGIAMV
ncbi:ATP-binding cassette domain-containing protein, partial [Klebsiella pneumoniae]